MPQQPNITARGTTEATLLGAGAIGLWTSLAALTALAGPIPPFQLSAMTFAIGAAVGLVWARLRGQPLRTLKTLPPASLALGIYGLLLFHVCYFAALQRAPVIEASLIIYLWPLLIVLFSGLLPGRSGGSGLGLRHIAGAFLGLCGTGLVLLGGGQDLAFGGQLSGYLLAGAAAVIWASYSVGSRLFTNVPSIAVTANCTATAIGALLAHMASETTVWPASPIAWGAVIMLGLGPVGLAFYLWDEGMKGGNIRLLGTLAYATPLLSTLLLSALGFGRPSAVLWLAAVLIAAGALLAGRP